MDTTKTITHVSLCSGYGGIDLGLKRVIPTLRTVAYSEIEAYACANLVAKMEAGLMDAAPIWTDLKTFPWSEFRDRVDILSGGYPCQPFSSAGKRLGAEDPRHLWPYIAAGIAAMRPRLVFFENVEGHISLGLREVIENLERLGYKATWGIFSASEVGAPHQRKRVFILAHRNDSGLEGGATRGRSWIRSGFDRCDFEDKLAHRDSQRGQLSNQRQFAAKQMLISNGEARRDVWPSRPNEPQHAWEPLRVVGNAENRNSGGNTLQLRPKEIEHRGASRSLDSGRRQTESSLGGIAHGLASGLDYAKLCIASDNRTDELRLLGNGVVPATAALAFQTLLAELL